MSLAGEEPAAEAAEIRLPADIDWEMLDKSRFFILGAALFSSVTAALYPVVVLKTRLQVSSSPLSSLRTASTIFRCEGLRGFYRGFGTSLTGTVPARALYMAALEVTKSAVGGATMRLGVPETASAAVANAAAGVSAAVAAQVVWTPVDVVSQRLMVQGSGVGDRNTAAKYRNGVDAFRKILMADGLRGLYRGFGISILTYAPSNAVWWASYSLSQRSIWGGIGYYLNRKGGSDIGASSSSAHGGNKGKLSDNDGGGGVMMPGYGTVVAVQAASAAVAGGMAALVTMPLDTIKTRMQVLDGGEEGKGRPLTVAKTVRRLVKEGGWAACYRGLGPRWASMSMSATTMITTYEFLKRLSAKTGAQDALG